jgi:hypothetical protein
MREVVTVLDTSKKVVPYSGQRVKKELQPFHRQYWDHHSESWKKVPWHFNSVW